MDDVACTGSEARLRDCSHNTTDNCGGGEGAGVVCSEFDREGESKHMALSPDLSHLVIYISLCNIEVSQV